MSIQSWIESELVSVFLPSVVRHSLSAIAGFLLTIGLTQAQVDAWQSATIPVVMAVLSYALALVLSSASSSNKTTQIADLKRTVAMQQGRPRP